MEQSLENGLITVLPNDITEYDYDSIIAQAEKAEKLVAALNTMMKAAIKITTHLDWVLIGGTPYLQESGATKVARLFGIGWKIVDVQRELDEGYPAFTYRMEFTMGRNVIECEGSRTGKDEFFTGRRTFKDGAANPQFKGPDAIDVLDVKKAAYTNCLNNGIKRMLPGLRNIDIASLEDGGIDASKVRGYSFADGEKGGKGKSAKDSGLSCSNCGTSITQKVASFSEGKYGRKLCMKCQKSAAAPSSQEQSAPPIHIPQNPPPPTYGDPDEYDDYLPPEPPDYM